LFGEFEMDDDFSEEMLDQIGAFNIDEEIKAGSTLAASTLPADLAIVNNETERYLRGVVQKIRITMKDTAVELAELRGIVWNQAKSVDLLVNPLISEPWLVGEIQDWAETNAGLWTKLGKEMTDEINVAVMNYRNLGSTYDGLIDAVKSTSKNMTNKRAAEIIESRFNKDIAAAALKNMEAGGSRKALAEIIQNIDQNVTKRRAKLIANDQVGKLANQITKIRAIRAEVGEYEWVTMRDDRVRPTHQALDRSIQTFGVGIEPGEEVMCRCVAMPIIETESEIEDEINDGEKRRQEWTERAAANERIQREKDRIWAQENGRDVDSANF